MDKFNVRAVAVSAVMGAVGFVLMALEFPLPFIIPSFIKMDFSELPAIITSFTFGPLYGILVCLIKNLLHLPMTGSAGVGELANFILGAFFVGVAGIIYKKNKSRKGALIGSVAGALAMSAVSIFLNYFIVYPAYVVLYGMSMDVIIGMYTAILPYSDSLLKSLLIFNLPFTFVKGIIDVVICFIVYKRFSPVLRFGRKGVMKNNFVK